MKMKKKSCKNSDMKVMQSWNCCIQFRLCVDNKPELVGYRRKKQMFEKIKIFLSQNHVLKWIARMRFKRRKKL